MAIFNSFPNIYCIDSNEQNKLVNYINELDAACFVLDGSHIHDTDSFYLEALSVLPLDPPLKGTSRNWDAFSDSLWEGLANLGRTDAVIIWTEADRTADSALGGLIEVCIVMNDIMRSLQDSATGIRCPVNLVLILLGHGKSFGALDI